MGLHSFRMGPRYWVAKNISDGLQVPAISAWIHHAHMRMHASSVSCHMHIRPLETEEEWTRTIGSLVDVQNRINLDRQYLKLLDMTVESGQGQAVTTCSLSHDDRAGAVTHPMLASLTLILGRERSSLNLVLCSVSRLSLSSAIDCFAGREGTILVGCLVWEEKISGEVGSGSVIYTQERK